MGNQSWNFAALAGSNSGAPYYLQSTGRLRRLIFTTTRNGVFPYNYGSQNVTNAAVQQPLHALADGGLNATLRDYARLKSLVKSSVDYCGDFDHETAMKVIAKYSRITDAEALNETYQHYAIKVMPKVPYPTIKGIQMVLDEIGSRTPKAKNLTPESFIDISYLRDLERAGIIKTLYNE